MEDRRKMGVAGTSGENGQLPELAIMLRNSKTYMRYLSLKLKVKKGCTVQEREQ